MYHTNIVLFSEVKKLSKYVEYALINICRKINNGTITVQRFVGHETEIL